MWLSPQTGPAIEAVANQYPTVRELSQVLRVGSTLWGPALGDLALAVTAETWDRTLDPRDMEPWRGPSGGSTLPWEELAVDVDDAIRESRTYGSYMLREVWKGTGLGFFPRTYPPEDKEVHLDQLIRQVQQENVAPNLVEMVAEIFDMDLSAALQMDQGDYTEWAHGILETYVHGYDVAAAVLSQLLNEIREGSSSTLLNQTTLPKWWSSPK